jgi:hypothetical protein
MAKQDPTQPACTSRVPSALCGGLKGLDRPLCRRRGPHIRHETKRAVRGLGYTTWNWNADAGFDVEQPPVIDIDQVPKMMRGHARDLIATAQARTGTVGAKGLRCTCPDYHIGVIHAAGCALTGLVR